MNTKILDNILLALVIIGAINWGLIRVFPLRSRCISIWNYELVLPCNLCTGRNQRYLPNQCLWPYPLHERCMKFIVISTQMKRCA